MTDIERTPEETEALYHQLDLHGVPLDRREEVIAVLNKIQEDIERSIEENFIGGQQLTAEEQLQKFVDGLNADPEYVRQYVEWRVQRPVKSAVAISDGIEDGQLRVTFQVELQEDEVPA